MAGIEDYIRYNNSGAVRNRPLDPKLTNALSFLKDMGITANVFSGGQPEADSGLARVGSVRHDNGLAGDMVFYKDGRRLDWANKDDLPLFQQIVERGRANGITGIGAGPGYMQPGSMHLGFGTPAVWGAKGRSANAPRWLRQAYYGGNAPPALQTASSAGTPLPTYDQAMAGLAGLPGKPDVVAEVVNAGPKSISMGAPQGDIGQVMPGADLPPLPKAGDLPQNQLATADNHPLFNPDKLGASLFGEEAADKMKSLFGADSASGAANPAKSGLGLLAGAFGGGKKDDAAAREAATIDRSSISNDDGAARMQAGSQLMATLMANMKKKAMPSMMMGA